MSADPHRARILCALLVALVVPTTASCGVPDALAVASGSIVVDIGLADALARRYGGTADVPIEIRATGSGEAESLARRGEVDVVFVHEPDVVRRLLDDGVGTTSAEFMRTEYVLAGPPRDPAGVRGDGLAAAFAALAASDAPFVSRGDRSGTHLEELRLWREAGAPGSRDHVMTGQGQADTLRIAAEREAYVLTDLATFRQVDPDRLVVVASDRPARGTSYEAVAIGGPRVHAAERLVAYLGSREVARFVDRWAQTQGLDGVVAGARAS